jgi:hypothetical protein
LFIVGAKAYLRGCWEDRELARLFLAGGGPAGSELLGRKRFREWARINERLLGGYDEPGGPSSEALVLVLTTVVAEAGHEVAVCDEEEKAMAFAGDVLTLIGRMAKVPV